MAMNHIMKRNTNINKPKEEIKMIRMTEKIGERTEKKGVIKIKIAIKRN